MFPQGEFYILSRKHGFALDVYDGQTKDDANIIVWPQKFQDSDNQLWSFVNGRLINKKSGHALDISSSAFRRDKTIVQKKVKTSKQSQEWVYDQGYICSKEYPTLVLDIKGDSEKGGAQILLYKKKDEDNLNQQWHFESYQQFEHTLNMATTTQPLHKKEGFGQPRLGYGAEVGIPEELKKLPDDIKVAGVGNNVSATPTKDTPDNSRNDPALAQYGSFYGEANIQMPSAPAGGVPLSPNNPRPDSSGPYPPAPGYPQHISSNPPGYPEANQSGYPPSHNSPHQPSYPQPGFPQPSISSQSGNQQPGFPQPSVSSGFPEPQVQTGYPAPPFSPSHATSANDFPHAPPSPSNYTQQAPGYPPNNTGYPPSGYPPNNANSYPPSAYPPSSGNYPPSSSSYGQPPQDLHNYPPYPQ
ncbi:ricin B lectin domain-containing protein [Sporodiniella umbellata]|nr:ricin B lectin domain-containing protein [Sporodiniella umbellata]